MEQKRDKIRCRVAACPEALGDGKQWSFYLLNDGVSLNRAVLDSFGHEWGDFGDSTEPGIEFLHVDSGSHVLLWRDNDEELNMWLKLRARADNREVELLFEFPKLYRRKDALPTIEELGRTGHIIHAEER